MSYQNISAALTAAQKSNVKLSIDQIRAILVFLVNLTPEERKRLRKMGFIRTSYVYEVHSAVTANPQAIPPSFNMAEYNKDFVLGFDLIEIMSWLRPLYEGLEDTTMALGNEVMKQSDELYGYLKVAAAKSGSQNLNMTVKRIADQLKHKPSDEETPNPQ